MKGMDTYLKIGSQKQLDSLIRKKQKKSDCPLECFVQLNFGIRSSKDISLDKEGKTYLVYHESDDTEEEIPHDSLMESSIGKAISAGALYVF